MDKWMEDSLDKIVFDGWIEGTTNLEELENFGSDSSSFIFVQILIIQLIKIIIIIQYFG